MNRTKWFDKKFNFDFPATDLPAIIERLRGTPARVEELIGTFPPEILTERVGEGWTIQENVGHLIDLEELHDGRLDDYASDKAELRAADLTNKKTYEADHNRDSIDNLLKTFRETRAAFVARFEAMDDDAAAKSSRHPRLQQPMRVVDMAYFVAEHDDHHLAIMTELARRLTNR